MSPEINKN